MVFPGSRRKGDADADALFPFVFEEGDCGLGLYGGLRREYGILYVVYG
jgi:hypothetical protein